MGSLSSKLENRLRVNFQTKKAMMPSTARPPATDMPTIGPVPMPSSCLSSLSAAFDADGVALDDFERVTTAVSVTSD